jgi:hypothetical protein
MKKKLLGLITCLSILISTSCTQTSPGGSNTGGGSSQLSWSCEIDGVPYSWSGTIPQTGTNDGSSAYQAATTGTNPSAIITLLSPSFAGKRKVILSISNPQVAIGTYNCNPNNSLQNCFASVLIDTSTIAFSATQYSSAYSPASFTVNINTLSPNTASNLGYGGAGIVSGTFSGTLTSLVPTSRTITITNGQFNALRLL